MIQINNLSKSFASNSLLEDVTLQIHSNEKVGLVGRNGHGKTTLFKIIIGEEEYDSGTIVVPRNYRIGYVSQHLKFSEDTILAEASQGLPHDQIDDVWKAEKILFGLGFDKTMVSMHPSQVSGGYQVRLNLAKTLLSSPNLLLLDEPTNYLDITSIRWLERFLKEWKEELLLITHDRSFMDQVVTHTACIYRKKIKKMPGTTNELYLQIAQEEEIYEKQRINDLKKRKQVETFINRFRAKARLANMVQSRVKELAKKEQKTKLEKIKVLDFEFNYAPFNTQILMQAEDLTFGYEKDAILIKKLGLTVYKNDRIAIVGPNGKGKSTLLKLLYEELTPMTGEVKKHARTAIGYFGQTNQIKLHPEHTIEEEVALANSTNNTQQVRSICGAVMFEGDNALKKIKILSGGEKSRVLLGKILATPTNLLLLDEPTNHLDMESCDALLAAIDNFDGAVIIVTHNEMFLNAIAQKLVVFDGGKTAVFEGYYDEFLHKVGWESEKEERLSIAQKSTASGSPVNKKELRKKRAGIIEEKSKVLKPVENKYKKLEKEIIGMEEELEVFNAGLQTASEKGDGDSIQKFSKKIHDHESRLQELYEEFELVSDEHEKITQEFEMRLNEIEV